MTLNNNLNENIVATSNNVLSNKKIGWGIKRAENHEQPDLGSSNLKLLQEYDGIAIYLNTAPELVERMINEGHIVGNQFTTMVMHHI